MRLPSWIRKLFSPTSQHSTKRAYARLGVEQLETRAVPAVFTVNWAGDEPDAMIGDGVAGIPNPGGGAPKTSLRAAIQEGNASTDAEVTINFNFKAPTTIGLGSALPELAHRFTINGPGLSDLTISRNAEANFRIFTTRFTDIVIRDLSITNGNADGVGEGGSGGAIANFGSLTLSNVSLYGNQAYDRGGAVFNGGNSLTLEGCSIYFNSADKGGGVYNLDQASIQLGTHIAANSAISGGGVFNTNGAQLSINTGSQVYANNATGVGGTHIGVGGGIANFGTLTMSDVILSDNTSVAEGGGLFSTTGTATLTNVIVQNNQATGTPNGKAGGIYVRSGTTTLVSGCTVSGNWAAWDTSIQENGWGISWATGALLTPNPLLNTIVDSIAYDPYPR